MSAFHWSSSWTSERKAHQRALSSPKIQGGWGWEFEPLALGEELGDTVCMILCRPCPSSRSSFHGDRAALEPAVVAVREAGPEMSYVTEQGPHAPFLLPPSFQAQSECGLACSLPTVIPSPAVLSHRALCSWLLAGIGCQ